MQSNKITNIPDEKSLTGSDSSLIKEVNKKTKRNDFFDNFNPIYFI